MSSSSRKASSLGLTISSVAVIAAATCLPSAATLAADTYVRPQFTVQTETNSNIDLTPGGSPDGDVYGFIADALALIGIASPRSEATVRPRLRYQDYPDRDDYNQLESFLDLRYLYNWQRAQFEMFGKYSRQDLFNVNQPSGAFDPLNPNDPANPDSSQITGGETRTGVSVLPRFVYDLTERTKVGVGATYDVVRYDADSGEPTQVDYDFWEAHADAAWVIDPRSNIGVGVYGSNYKATDDSTESDGYGVEVGYAYRWSEVTGARLRVFYNTDDTTDYVPVRTSYSSSGMGAVLTAYRKFESGQWRLTTGRTFIPTGDGGKATSDQFRVQYIRNLSERLSFYGAARYEARNALSKPDSDVERDYARLDLSLRWLFTPTWFVDGGYAYIWEDKKTLDGDGDNNRVFVSVGYAGLGPQH